MNNIKNIIKMANSEKPRKYNILTFPTHERYETQLCKTGHNFYSFSLADGKHWNKNQTSVPENYYIMPYNKVVNYIDFDMILVQSKFWQYQIAMKILQNIPIPLIVLEHTLPTPQTMSIEQIEVMRNMVGNMNIFISNFSKNAWSINYNNKIIHHGIDTETFKPIENIKKENYVLTVANDFKNRDYCLNYSGWQRITNNYTTKLIGENNGENALECQDVNQLANEYNKCAVYLNTTTFSPIPMSLLEAMSCGCAVVSTATCMIPDIIENGVNGFISNNESELQKYINELLNNAELRTEIGKKARQTIEKLFSENSFINNWNETFDQIYEGFNK